MVTFLLYFLLPLLGFLGAMTIIMIFKLYYHGELNSRGGQILYSNQILPNQLAGREKEIRHLVRKITTGQSSAIIGAFGNERTAILNALRNRELYGNNAERFIFSFLDISTLEKECSRAQFWEYVLEPLQDKVTDETDLAVSKAYQFCQENNFNNRSLEKLFEQMKQNNWRLVLMLNWFEEILAREFLNDEAFFSNLRSLASHYPSPLNLVIAVNKSFQQFYKDLNNLPQGSPYFNFLESGTITLGILSEEDINEFLKNSDPRFTQTDRNFLKESTGGHPYLLQRATAILMDAYDNQETKPLDSAKTIFWEEAENILTNVLQLLSPPLCRAFVLVAQKQEISGEFKEELDELHKQGLVKEENSQWRIRSSVFAELMSNKVEQEICQ